MPGEMSDRWPHLSKINLVGLVGRAAVSTIGEHGGGRPAPAASVVSVELIMTAGPAA